MNVALFVFRRFREKQKCPTFSKMERTYTQKNEQSSLFFLTSVKLKFKTQKDVIKMKKLQESIVLKTISYILMPLMVLNILINTFSITYYDEYKEEIESGITYFQTERFAEKYFRKIYLEINNISIMREYENKQTSIMITDSSSSLEKDEINDNKFVNEIY